MRTAGASHPRRVLLVHGAWHGAWCWERVAASLRALGCAPEAIDLPGHGMSAESLTDLHGDADAVQAHLDAIGGPTLLVGHSYGGMVITDAGVHDAVAGLAYVSAYMPDAGQTLLGLFTGQAHPEGKRPSELVAAIRFSDDRAEMRLEGDAVANALYRDCDPATQQWAIARLDAQSTASFNQAPRRVAWKSRPATYVVCTQDRTIPVWLQRTMAERADRVIDLQVSHSPFLSMPERLAGVLAEALTRALPTASTLGLTRSSSARRVVLRGRVAK